VSDRALRDALEKVQADLQKARTAAERAQARSRELEDELKSARTEGAKASAEAQRLRADLADAERAFRHVVASLAATREERRALEKKLSPLPAAQGRHVSGVPDSWFSAVLDLLGLS
jgi:septal ring factor EnvC (AmiA/AmiB activator)